jgi:hypothetical protein
VIEVDSPGFRVVASTVCTTAPLFVHLTVSPALMVIVAGEKKLSRALTS